MYGPSKAPKKHKKNVPDPYGFNEKLTDISLSVPKLQVRLSSNKSADTLFSSPEHKLRVSYCHHPMSVVRRRPSSVVNN